MPGLKTKVMQGKKGIKKKQNTLKNAWSEKKNQTIVSNFVVEEDTHTGKTCMSAICKAC